MPPSEKQNLQSNLIDTSIPTDSPPSYEHTITPNSNPWNDTPSTPSAQPSQSTTQAQSQPFPSIPSQNPFSAFSRLSTVPFSKYRVRDSKISDDQTTVMTSSPDLTPTSSNSNIATLQRNLNKFLAEQASLPPKPIMIVKGTHLGGRDGTTQVDFELKFNLTSLLDLSRGGDDGVESQSGGSSRGRGDEGNARTPSKIKVDRYEHGSSNGSPRQLSREEKNMSPLELWVKKFCEDKAENRSFTLTRHIRTLPTALLEGHFRTLLATLKYRGKVTVDFPLHNASVIIHRKSSNWFTNMLRLYPTKKYEVLNVEWSVVGTNAEQLDQAQDSESSPRPQLQRKPTDHSTTSATSATSQPSPSSSSPSSDSNGLPAMVAQAWWREWQLAIWNAVLNGKRGWVTVEDWMEAKMGVREKEKGVDWGVDWQ